MNYGYAGTRELNEALVSRFLVIDMPLQDEETLNYLLDTMFPGMKEAAKKAFIGLYLDLQKKAGQAEISTQRPGPAGDNVAPCGRCGRGFLPGRR